MTDATCDKCQITTARTSVESYQVVSLCPLHAEAEAMRDVLKRARDEWDAGLTTDGTFLALQETADAARTILARIESPVTPHDGGA